MSIAQLLRSGGNLSDVGKLVDPRYNNFGPPPPDNSGPGDDKISINDSAGIKTGKYSKDRIQGLIKAAKAVGMDPSRVLQAVAVDLQETGLGTEKVKMRRGKQEAEPGQVHDFSEQQQKELDEIAEKTDASPEYLKLAIALRDKLKVADKLGYKDEAQRLQAYNGYGIITKDKFGGADKAYGVPIGEGIDLKKNPLYGKRVLQLSKDLQSNQEVMSLINAK
jgi:aldehyde:ferredoxin oxidoreductase